MSAAGLIEITVTAPSGSRRREYRRELRHEASVIAWLAAGALGVAPAVLCGRVILGRRWCPFVRFALTAPARG